MPIHITPEIEAAFEAHLNEEVDWDFRGQKILRRETTPFFDNPRFFASVISSGRQFRLATQHIDHVCRALLVLHADSAKTQQLCSAGGEALDGPRCISSVFGFDAVDVVNAGRLFDQRLGRLCIDAEASCERSNQAVELRGVVVEEQLRGIDHVVVADLDLVRDVLAGGHRVDVVREEQELAEAAIGVDRLDFFGAGVKEVHVFIVHAKSTEHNILCMYNTISTLRKSDGTKNDQRDGRGYENQAGQDDGRRVGEMQGVGWIGMDPNRDRARQSYCQYCRAARPVRSRIHALNNNVKIGRDISGKVKA